MTNTLVPKREHVKFQNRCRRGLTSDGKDRGAWKTWRVPLSHRCGTGVSVDVVGPIFACHIGEKLANRRR